MGGWDTLMRPTVDFALMCHNRIAAAIVAIDSILAQEGVDGRLIVVDQNSEAGPLQALKDRCAVDPRITLYCSPVNLGVSRGRNYASSFGSAPYIVWLDDDARFVDAHQVERAVALADSDPKIAAVAFRFVNEDGSETAESEEMGRRARNNRFVAFIGAGFLLRRSAFDAAGRFDPKLFFYHEESDLCMRLVNMGYRVVYSPDVTAVHPFGRNPSARRAFVDVRNTIYIEGKYNYPLSIKRRSVVNAFRITVRRGYLGAALRGLASGVLMLPAAFAQRFYDRRVRLSREIREYVRPPRPKA